MKIRNVSAIVQDIIQALSREGVIDDKSLQDLDGTVRQALSLAYPSETNPQLVNASIMMADIRGFTSISEALPPNDLIQLLNTYFSGIVDVITRYDGRIDKFIGDAVMAVFPAETDEEVLNTLRCAIDIQQAMEDINAELERSGSPILHMGIGINTGEVVSGLIGSPQYQELTVIGSHVNLASRVESYSMRGQVLISSNTLARCPDVVSIGSVYDVQPKGNQQTIKIHELLSINTPSRLQVPRISQRRYVRADIQLSLKFNIVEDKHLSPALYDATTVDISYTGIGIITPQQLTLLMEVRIILSMSLLGPQIREVYAKVTRLSEVDGHYHAGLEFTSIDEHSLEAIKAYIDKQLTHI